MQDVRCLIHSFTMGATPSEPSAHLPLGGGEHTKALQPPNIPPNKTV